jgi:Protein of unknown function (DUF3892)
MGLEGETVASYTVTGVRKETSKDGTHKHIAGVCTSNGTYYSREDVIASINAGDTWKTSADGYEATIKVVDRCPHGTNCEAAPYIQTNPDSTKKDNLENLDAC